ncbi:MAG: hypothetical protein KBT02_08825 [Treponema sp.]|nr:hypothetical protein [Candidatus Treponema caballi]
MNTRNIIKSFICCICLFSLFSCASPPRRISSTDQSDDFFLADLPGIQLEPVMLLCAKGTSSVASVEVNSMFYPRTGNLQLRAKTGTNNFQVIFSYEDRKALYEDMQKYVTLLQSNKLPDRAPAKTNAFSTGKADISWGVLGYGYDAKGLYYTNYEYLEEDKPYFSLTFNPSRNTEGDTWSPLTIIYFSPSQIQDVYDIMSLEVIKQQVDEKTRQVFEY